MSTIAILKTSDLHRIRNAQVGDWKIGKHILGISAKMSSPDSELAVAIHELIEAWECRKSGITDEQVTNFDRMFEEERDRGLHSVDAEDGDDIRAPYLVQHRAATHVERSVCEAIGLSWDEHCNNVSKLFP